ncbi:MAG: hypothetical protein ACREM2_02040 [Vulcanimicrobiaceae bacterium]
MFVAAILGLSGSPAWSDTNSAQKPSKSAGALVFVGPPGWQHVHGTNDGLGTWLRPGNADYSQNIVVVAKDGIGSLDALLAAEIAYFRGLPDVFGYAPTDTSVCENHPAKYISFTYTSPTGLPVTSEIVIAVFETRGYSARYNKSITQDPDAAAERSLRTLCGRAASR